MLNQNPVISIISPMNNEEASAVEFVSRVDKVLSERNDSYEIIIINDGSTDNTGQILTEIKPKFPFLKIISLARNSGQWAATLAGMEQSKGKYIVIMDSDLQNLPEEIPLLINKIKEGYELVSGARKKRKESWLLRRVPSFFANLLLRRVTKCPTRDMGGFKCIDGKIARKLRLRAGQHRFLPALVWQMGGRVIDVSVSAPPRLKGKSHYSFSRAYDVIFDIILFWLQNSCKARPIYLFGRFSFFSFLFSFLIFIWLLVEKIFFHINLGTRPPFFLALIGFLSSFIFITFGFTLEFLSSIQNNSLEHKPYIIKSIEE